MKNQRNPYVDNDSPPTLQPSVVAYIDILGYQDLVEVAEKNNESLSTLQRLYQALSQSRRHINPQENEVSQTFFKKDEYAFRAFTDNIVIGHPIVDDGELELGSILTDLSYFQTTMISEGFLSAVQSLLVICTWMTLRSMAMA